MNNHLFWIDFSDLNQTINLLLFVGIRHYSSYCGESYQIIHFDSLRFDLLRFNLFYASFYDSSRLFFIRFNLF